MPASSSSRLRRSKSGESKGSGEGALPVSRTKSSTSSEGGWGECQSISAGINFSGRNLEVVELRDVQAHELRAPVGRQSAQVALDDLARVRPGHPARPGRF